MAKISAYSDGGDLQSTDQTVINRGGKNYHITGDKLIGSAFKSVLSASKSVSSSRTWVDAGDSLDITLPAGTWDLSATLLGIIQTDGTANTWIKARFFNETAGSEIDNNYCQLAWLPNGDTHQRRQSGVLHTIAELAVTSTIRIEVYSDYGPSEPAWVTRLISSDINGRSVFIATKIK